VLVQRWEEKVVIVLTPNSNNNNNNRLSKSIIIELVINITVEEPNVYFEEGRVVGWQRVVLLALGIPIPPPPLSHLELFIGSS
jgi:hypothetical protein